MPARQSTSRSAVPLPVVCLCVAFLLGGCKSNPAPDDAALTANSRAQLSTDSALAGQSITATANNGIVNLNGNVANDAQKTLAARDVAGIPGVKAVNNNLMVGPATTTVIAPPPIPIPVPFVPVPIPGQTIQQARDQQRAQDHAQELAQQREQQRELDLKQRQNPPAPVNPRQPAPVERPLPAGIPAPAAAQPTYRNVNVPVGTTIPVRVTQTLDSATTQEGDAFSGVVASDVIVDGATVIPAGSTVSGRVDVVHEAGHFSGSSLLTVSLASVNKSGERLGVSSDPYSVQGKGRGTNTAEKVGGGAAVGAILGGIFGGGKGAAIGAAAGGGVGAGVNGITKGQQVQIPSETVVRFHLSAPLSVRARTDLNATPRPVDSLPPGNVDGLQRRNP